MPFQVGGVSSHSDSSHQGDAKRNVANGVAGLDAAAKFAGMVTADNEPSTRATAITTHEGSNVSALIHPNANTHIAATAPHSLHANGSSGSFSGDTTTNRAIAHGLGRTPKLIMLTWDNATNRGIAVIQAAAIAGRQVSGSALDVYTAVTAPDGTNFYVSGSQVNGTGYTTTWTAIG